MFWYSLNLWHISHSKKNWARYDHKCIRVKCPFFLTDFNGSWIFSADFRNTLQCQIYWKSVQWEQSCYMRTDGRTRRTDKRTAWQSWQSLFAILWTRLKIAKWRFQYTGIWCRLNWYINDVSVNLLLPSSEQSSTVFHYIEQLTFAGGTDRLSLWPLKKGPKTCPETSVRNYHPTPRKIPEERISDLHRGGSPKSRTAYVVAFPLQK